MHTELVAAGGGGRDVASLPLLLMITSIHCINGLQRQITLLSHHYIINRRKMHVKCSEEKKRKKKTKTRCFGGFAPLSEGQRVNMIGTTIPCCECALFLSVSLPLSLLLSTSPTYFTPFPPRFFSPVFSSPSTRNCTKIHTHTNMHTHVHTSYLCLFHTKTQIIKT